MIVDPDFLDHWRTRMVVDALGGDEFAPFYIMRLWGHCQTRRASSFNIPAAGLKALCRYSGEASILETALADAGFVIRDGDELHLPKWEKHNASLIANWDNGKTGGRPKNNPIKTQTKPNQNPPITQPEPIHNPNETQQKPNRNPSITDKIREEKIREEESLTPNPPTQRASRLPADWRPSQEHLDFCRTERTDLDPHQVASRFKDFWVAKPGKDGLKLDWMATWRNWVRNERLQIALQKQTAWWATDETILAKGEELNLRPGLGESMQTFKGRIQAAIDNGGKPPPPKPFPPIVVAAEPKRVEISPEMALQRSSELREALKAKVVT